MGLQNGRGGTVEGVTDYPPTPTERVQREVMRMWWEDLTFIHYAYDPDVVQRLLPDGLTADSWPGPDGEKVWVGLVPFRMRVGLPGGRPMPPRIGDFPETNVRTYVRGPDGTPGVYFFSLEAGALGATVSARVAYGLPYFWADMTIDEGDRSPGGEWAYASTRRWPKPKGDQPDRARHVSRVRIGEAIDEASEFEHYLTARWGLFSTLAGRNLYAAVDHPSWVLHRAELLELDDELVIAAGLPKPTSDPVVHWTPGLEVRIGRPRRA